MAERPEHHNSVLDSIQTEVTKETSPLLEFLINNVKSIFAGICLLLIAFGAYSYYASQQEEKKLEQQAAFSNLLATSTAENRIAKLEEYLTTAPQENKLNAYLAIAKTAQDQKNYAKSYEAWQQIAALQPDLAPEATVAMAQALVNQNKAPEALALLEGLLAKAPQQYAMHINGQIVTVAESIKNYKRAVEACTIVVNNTTEPQSLMYWKQKLAVLELAAKQAQ